ncbi:hypothetical protein WJX84_001406 [Apatococcus fuscideae]|uniref:NAD(P)-binding domain-containing protein n=1 Tax=Apatococcus fuscideae TaxID=2026836 RepID=A0AAW1THH5_9CHLO
MAIAVVGAGGPTGRLCVERLLEAGHSVRAIATGIIYVAAASTYLSAKAVDNEGVKSVANIAKKLGAHMVLVSTALATPKNRWNPATILLNTVIRYNCVNEKYAGENALRQSGTTYTVIRPSGLTNGPRGKAELLTDQSDYGGLFPMIARADVATVCVAAMCNPKAYKVTFELRSNNKKAPGPSDMDILFDNLRPDTLSNIGIL